MKAVVKKLGLLFLCLVVLCGITIIFAGEKAMSVKAKEDQTEKIADVYLIAGQSNAVGSTLIANGASPVYQQQNNSSFANSAIKYENVLYNHNVHPTTTGSGYLITDFVPVTQGLGYTQAKNHIGPELGMAEYLDPIYAQKENTDAIIIKVGAGGTSLINHYDDANINIQELKQINDFDATYGTWYPESLWNVTNGGLAVDLWDGQYYRHPTGLLYRELITFLSSNYELMQKAGYTKINFKSLCWLQGTTDKGNESRYKVVFDALISDIRGRLSEITGEDYSSLPIVCGEISRTFASARESEIEKNKKFIAMQHEIAQSLNQYYVVNTSEFLINDFDKETGAEYVNGSDSWHWNYLDMLEIGYLLGEKMYSINSDNKWLYLNVSSNKSDHMDKTTIENVKTNIDEFNKNGKLSFTCDLKTKYIITSLTLGEDFDLMPYLLQKVTNGVREYVLMVEEINNKQDQTINLHFTNADTYNVSVSIAQEGNGYGEKIYTYENKVYANAGYYELEAHPAQDGRVYKVTINDIEVEGAKNNATIVLDDIFDYLNGQSDFKIVVQYSPIPPLRIEASGYIGTFEVGEQFSTDGLVVKFLDQLDNETVLSANDYTVDSSKFNPNQVGKYLITITYGDYKYNYTVDVVAPKIEIENAKTLFLIGEQFSIGEAKVYLVTKAGKTLLEEGQYTVTTVLFNSKYAGTYDILVSGQGASGTYKVQVVAPDSIEVSGAKTEFSGEEFSTGDIVVKAKVGDDEYLLDASSYTVDSTQFNKDESGTYTITVSACGKSATYEVTVTVSGGNTETPEKGESGSSSSGCGANAMEIFTLVAGLCALAFVFKKSR